MASRRRREPKAIRTRSTLTLLIIANLTAVASLAFLAISLGTDGWIFITVDRVALKNGIKVKNEHLTLALNKSLYQDPLFFTRSRGIFITCLADPSESSIYRNEGGPIADNLRVDKGCFRLEWTNITEEQIRVQDKLYPGYNARIHLVRLHVALFAIGLFFALLLSLLSMIVCWTAKVASYSSACKTLGGLNGFVIALGMLTFHIYEYLESEMINKDGFYRNWRLTLKDPLRLLSQWNLYSYGYQYSYYFGWVALSLSFFCALQFTFIRYIVKKEQKERKLKLESNKNASANTIVQQTQHSIIPQTYATLPYSANAAVAYMPISQPAMYSGTGATSIAQPVYVQAAAAQPNIYRGGAYSGSSAAGFPTAVVSSAATMPYMKY